MAAVASLLASLGDLPFFLCHVNTFKNNICLLAWSTAAVASWQLQFFSEKMKPGYKLQMFREFEHNMCLGFGGDSKETKNTLKKNINNAELRLSAEPPCI